ncbi:hypothetical protein C8F01DRAFT_1135908 [Mycena amicta]|nr:hypothetical protein C8F01DRAFT_1135908 [Mycena amicta]
MTVSLFLCCVPDRFGVASDTTRRGSGRKRLRNAAYARALAFFVYPSIFESEILSVRKPQAHLGAPLASATNDKLGRDHISSLRARTHRGNQAGSIRLPSLVLVKDQWALRRWDDADAVTSDTARTQPRDRATSGSSEAVCRSRALLEIAKEGRIGRIEAMWKKRTRNGYA